MSENYRPKRYDLNKNSKYASDEYRIEPTEDGIDVGNFRSYP